MLRLSVLFLSVLTLTACEPIQEKILGTYEINPDRGCASCKESGPQSIAFEDGDTSDGIQGNYLFEFEDGQYHSGSYGFLQVDTMVTVILYPEDASFDYTPLIGTNLRKDYRVNGDKIKEDCEGLFRNCVWDRR